VDAVGLAEAKNDLRLAKARRALRLSEH
jgi:hypothetical protein